MFYDQHLFHAKCPLANRLCWYDSYRGGGSRRKIYTQKPKLSKYCIALEERKLFYPFRDYVSRNKSATSNHCCETALF